MLEIKITKRFPIYCFSSFVPAAIELDVSRDRNSESRLMNAIEPSWECVQQLLFIGKIQKRCLNVRNLWWFIVFKTTKEFFFVSTINNIDSAFRNNYMYIVVCRTKLWCCSLSLWHFIQSKIRCTECRLLLFMFGVQDFSRADGKPENFFLLILVRFINYNANLSISVFSTKKITKKVEY